MDLYKKRREELEKVNHKLELIAYAKSNCQLTSYFTIFNPFIWPWQTYVENNLKSQKRTLLKEKKTLEHGIAETNCIYA